MLIGSPRKFFWMDSGSASGWIIRESEFGNCFASLNTFFFVCFVLGSCVLWARLAKKKKLIKFFLGFKTLVLCFFGDYWSLG